MATQTPEYQPNFLKATYPVLFPSHPALNYNQEEFESFLKKVQPLQSTKTTPEATGGEGDDTTTLFSQPTETSTTEVRRGLHDMVIENKQDEHPFMNAIHSAKEDAPNRDMTNIMQTENADLAHRNTEPLVDLFFELEDVVAGPRLRELLELAWQTDPLTTLKIIFNARSIHLGKGSRIITYKCFGWLAQQHPGTLLVNLQWLSRPVIEKKLADNKQTKEGDDMVVVEAENAEDDPLRFDVENGVSHGYWKDMLNMLVLAVEGKLDVLANPKDVLNIKDHGKMSKRVWDAVKAKELRRQTTSSRHAAAIRAFDEQPFYSALHLTISRLFADQLKSDLALLRSEDKKAIRRISLCAKWAPSQQLFHDKHTRVVSTIAELLHPQPEFPNISDRELYLRYAREAYRKDISALRKALGVVEREISAQTFENIHYDRVPSQAMNRYASLFAQKDTDRFDAYISKVAEGQKKISGATLLPSTLISKARGTHNVPNHSGPKKGTKSMVEAKIANIDAAVLDGQWKTLVQRIRDSGKLENSIAVADVSGSMTGPRFSDGTCPLDSSIGLSLLVAEVTAPPFGGSFITFSSKPKVERVQGDTLQEKVRNLERADWEMSTDFVAVFEKLILPMAKKHNVKQEDMVKSIFVFSDMQFNSADTNGSRWTTSYERIKKQFEEAGYEMPQLIFWNLAGGRAGRTGVGDPTAPKPVTATEGGTALVSGYSQGMLKVFLDNGAFEDPEAEEEIVEKEIKDGEDDEEVVVQVTKKQKTDPMSVVRKAVSHKAYSMLKVVD